MSHGTLSKEQAAGMRVTIGNVAKRALLEERQKVDRDETVAATFNLRAWQLSKVGEWQNDHECTLTSVGAIGGALTFEFTNTNLGQVQKCKCACGAELDLTDYSDW